MNAKHDKTEPMKPQADRSQPKAGIRQQRKDSNEVKDLTGYPEYPVIEDIYNQYRKEDEIDPEDISKTKESDYADEKLNKKEFSNISPNSDLDIPGAELDDDQESVGSEDEENNYYSLGGDDHNNLEEGNV